MGLFQFLPPLPHSDRPELLDGVIVDKKALAENLRDLRYADVLLGATRTLWREVRPLLTHCHPHEPITLLDLATGDAHTPTCIAAYARQSGYMLDPYASDILIEALRLGVDKHWKIDNKRVAISGDRSPVRKRHTTLICLDALHIPACDGAFDFVTCNLALHHFAPGDALSLLREMRRVARVAVVVVDLQRTWLAYLGACLMALGPWGTMARHDGPLSVLRAYTPPELCTLLASSGVSGRIRVVSPLLVSVVARVQ